VFLTPNDKPFYGCTYFPPRAIYNRKSWKDVLTGIAAAFREKRAEIEQQAEYLTNHVSKADAFGIGDAERAADSPFRPDTLHTIYEKLMEIADRREGGFGPAPKFPQTFSIQYLLHFYYYTREKAALDQACLSLDKMIRGGIYDQLGGGFARYSTDNEWLAPHFEKMLYDNALLVIVLSEAYQLTGSALYREAIGQTMEFIDRELSNGEGGFYAALDADSEGEEGKYYVWDKAEIESVLGEDAELFCKYYGVTDRGNWEGKNILVRKGFGNGADPADPGIVTDGSGNREMGPKIAEHERLEKDADARERLGKARLLLLEYRGRRVRPALDDKILLGWNALMTVACAKAYGATGVEEYKDRAVANIAFCRSRMKGKDDGMEGPGGSVKGKDAGMEGPGGLVNGKDDGIYAYFHSHKDGKAKFPAFLDDYAYLIAALLQVQEITGDTDYLLEARELVQYVVDHFGDEKGEFFYFTHEDQGDVILRKREVYDGATPSGNSMMAWNLRYLSIIFNMPDWGERAARMAAAVQKPIVRYPSSFGIWATLFQALTYNIEEIVITGRRLKNARQELLRQFIPYRVLQSSEAENTQFPLLTDRRIEDRPLLYLCKNYSCQLPVNEVTALLRLLENV
jgi:uncharacterized protein YyaL (SSP411 family)